MEELWKDIKGYEGIYQVSNLGNIRKLVRVTNKKNGSVYLRVGKILSSYPSSGGYKQYYAFDRKIILVHRAVAQAFVPIPNDLLDLVDKKDSCGRSLLQVNHKNENILDNRAENLEWCTPHYNANYGKRNEKVSDKKRLYNVEQLDEQGNVLARYESVIEAGKAVGVHKDAIRKACAGSAKHSAGYRWRYVKRGE